MNSNRPLNFNIDAHRHVLEIEWNLKDIDDLKDYIILKSDEFNLSLDKFSKLINRIKSVMKQNYKNSLMLTLSNDVIGPIEDDDILYTTHLDSFFAKPLNNDNQFKLPNRKVSGSVTRFYITNEEEMDELYVLMMDNFSPIIQNVEKKYTSYHVLTDFSVCGNMTMKDVLDSLGDNLTDSAKFFFMMGQISRMGTFHNLRKEKQWFPEYIMISCLPRETVLSWCVDMNINLYDINFHKKFLEFNHIQDAMKFKLAFGEKSFEEACRDGEFYFTISQNIDTSWERYLSYMNVNFKGF